MITLVSQLKIEGQNSFNLQDSIFEVGQICILNIKFEFSGGCNPTTESLPLLDSLCNFLKYYEHLKIEIGVHTDFSGTSIYNRDLSEFRAKRVKAYLRFKGINISRLEHKGYGESSPIIITRHLNRQYPFLEVGEKLTETYIKNLENRKIQIIANSLNSRVEIKILVTNQP